MLAPHSVGHKFKLDICNDKLLRISLSDDIKYVYWSYNFLKNICQNKNIQKFDDAIIKCNDDFTSNYGLIKKNIDSGLNNYEDAVLNIWCTNS